MMNGVSFSLKEMPFFLCFKSCKKSTKVDELRRFLAKIASFSSIYSRKFVLRKINQFAIRDGDGPEVFQWDVSDLADDAVVHCAVADDENVFSLF